MFGLLLFTDTVSLWVRDSDTNYQKKKALKTWQGNNKEARSIICIAHLKGCLVINDW